MNNSIEQDVLKIAVDAHRGMTRRDGTAYINHPVRVAKAVSSWCEANNISAEGRFRAVCVAFLHDVLEDTSMTPEELEEHLLEAGVSQLMAVRIVHDCETLTHDPVKHATYDDYVTSVIDKGSISARLVKLMDMRDNMEGCMEEIRTGVNYSKKSVRQLSKYLLYVDDFINSVKSTS